MRGSKLGHFGGLFASLMLLLLALGPSACALEHDEPSGDADTDVLRESKEPIVYGVDDRLEVYQHPNKTFRALATSSVVALVPFSRFMRTTGGSLALFSPTLSTAFNVCPDQRFADQLTAADCSGVLFDDDLVLTAAHCFQSDDDCSQYVYMFDYFYRERGQHELNSWGDIYGCRRIVARTLTPRGVSPRIDFAVVQLDRAPVGRTPVATRTTPLALGEKAIVLGCPSGLPFKIDSGGEVLSTRTPQLDYFLLDSDTFQGSSGSGVFDEAGELVGTLVRGGDDYASIPDGACVVPKVVTSFESDASAALKLAVDGGMVEVDAEEATYVARAIDGVCTAGWPSERLCSSAPRCGDGFCTMDETRASCPADCACANGACLDGGNFPAGVANSGALDKSRGDGGAGCAVARNRFDQARSGAWFALAFGLLLARRRGRCRARGRRRQARR